MVDKKDLNNPKRIKDEELLKLAAEKTDIALMGEIGERLIRLSQYESLCLLAAGKAHDFRNLLSIVSGNLTLSKIKYADHTQLVKWLDDSEAALAQAFDLANQLLDMSKSHYQSKKVVSLNGFLQQTTEMALGAYDVEPSYYLDDDLENVFIDKGQMHQVIVNLLMNAVQAMHNQGKIWITAINEEIKAAQGYLAPGRYVKISIRDEGGGIPEKYWGELFQSFFTTKDMGSGLGLSTSKAIVNQHQGHMDFICDDEGTTFIIYLPAVLADPTNP